MDVVYTTYYRYNFGESLLRSGLSSEGSRPASGSDTQNRSFKTYMKGDVITLSNRGYPQAPQGIGENKHHSLNTENVSDVPEKTELDPVYQKEDDFRSDTALRSRVLRRYGPGAGVREEMERQVRRRKILNLPCPHRDKNGMCSALFLRCGDRMQFGIPETQEQRNRPHICLYNPLRDSRNILVISSNDDIREFCKNTLSIFFRYSSSFIYPASSQREAEEALNEFKIEGQPCRLVIVDTEIDDTSGYEFINSLYYRNYITSVLLLLSERAQNSPPSDYVGNIEIAPGRRFEVNTIRKPFHSDDLTKILSDMGIHPEKSER